MPYVDGFVLPVKKSKLAAYRALARKAGKIWCEHGALDYVECVFDDPPKGMLAFPKAFKTKTGETVMFSWIMYTNKAHRNKVNAKIMADPRIAAMCDPENMPFDVKRMAYSGFQVLVSAKPKPGK